MAETKKIILVVDDEEECRALLKTALERRGFGVVVAKSVKTAFQVINGAVLNLIITDLEMPDKNGLEMVREVRNHSDSRVKETPIIMLTGADEKIHRPVAEAAGVNLYCSKPVNLAKFIEEAEKHMR